MRFFAKKGIFYETSPLMIKNAAKSMRDMRSPTGARHGINGLKGGCMQRATSAILGQKDPDPGSRDRVEAGAMRCPKSTGKT
jgi:hypothetical protein